MSKTVLANQTILDMAIQECGSIEDAIQLAILNDLSVSDDVAPGTELEIPQSVISVDNRARVKADKVEPATKRSALIDAETGEVIEPDLQGINYWAIGIDFIVS